jgi:hypothetical protein
VTRARWTISGKVVRMKKHTSQSRQVDQEGVPARPPAGFVAQGVNFAKRFRAIA